MNAHRETRTSVAQTSEVSAHSQLHPPGFCGAGTVHMYSVAQEGFDLRPICHKSSSGAYILTDKGSRVASASGRRGYIRWRVK